MMSQDKINPCMHSARIRRLLFAIPLESSLKSKLRGFTI